MSLRDRFISIKEKIQDRMPEDVQQWLSPASSDPIDGGQEPDLGAFPHRLTVPLDLGQCSDDLPVRIDLNDPELEPMVAISNEVSELQDWVAHILQQLNEAHSEGDVEVALLKRRSTNLERLVKAAEAKGILVNQYEMNPRREWEYLYEVAQRAEQRFAAPTHDMPPVVLLIEDLTFLKFASSDLQLTFEWLLQFGREVGIQIIAAVTCEDGYSQARWLRYFPTRFFGSIRLEDDHHFNYFDTLPPVPQKIRYAGTTFAIWGQTHWLFFVLHPSQDTQPGEKELDL